MMDAHNSELDVTDDKNRVSAMDSTAETADEYKNWKDMGKKGECLACGAFIDRKSIGPNRTRSNRNGRAQKGAPQDPKLQVPAGEQGPDPTVHIYAVRQRAPQLCRHAIGIFGSEDRHRARVPQVPTYAMR
ncbi:unnamed protein product [Sphagnum balticum]